MLGRRSGPARRAELHPLRRCRPSRARAFARPARTASRWRCRGPGHAAMPDCLDARLEVVRSTWSDPSRPQAVEVAPADPRGAPRRNGSCPWAWWRGAIVRRPRAGRAGADRSRRRHDGRVGRRSIAHRRAAPWPQGSCRLRLEGGASDTPLQEGCTDRLAVDAGDRNRRSRGRRVERPHDGSGASARVARSPRRTRLPRTGRSRVGPPRSDHGDARRHVPLVRRPPPGIVPVRARADLRPLPPTTPRHGRQRLPRGPDRGVPDLARGDVRPTQPLSAAAPPSLCPRRGMAAPGSGASVRTATPGSASCRSPQSWQATVGASVSTNSRPSGLGERWPRTLTRVRARADAPPSVATSLVRLGPDAAARATDASAARPGKARRTERRPGGPGTAWQRRASRFMNWFPPDGAARQAGRAPATLRSRVATRGPWGSPRRGARRPSRAAARPSRRGASRGGCARRRIRPPRAHLRASGRNGARRAAGRR